MKLIDEAKAQSWVEAERIIASPRSQIAQEQQKAKEQLREHVAALAVAGAEKNPEKEIDAKARRHAQSTEGATVMAELTTVARPYAETAFARPSKLKDVSGFAANSCSWVRGAATREGAGNPSAQGKG